MARPLKPFIRGGGFYPSNKWIPLVYNGGYTTMDGGEEPEPPTPVYWKTIAGVSPLVLASAMQEHIRSLTQYGLCTQSGTPTPDAPVDILCNNGAIKLRRPSGMPIAYQMVEWLKPAGSIPITGFKTKSTQEITTVFYRESRGSSYLYSSDTATSGTTNTTAYLTTAGGNWRWDGKVATINPATGVKITSVQNEDGVWINGTRYGVYTDAGEFVSTNDLRLSSNENTTVRIYSMTIREGETVTLDLVPVQRVTDNAYGFYDKVSGNFYTNADATFDAGDPIPDPVEIYTDGEDEVLTVSADGAETQTVTDIPMLLSVGDYKDEAEIIQGIKTGRVGIKVFDGTEDWVAYTSSTLVIQNATSAWGAVAGVGGYCTHLTVLKAGETTFAGACRFATAFNVYDYKTAFGVADVAGFKAFLAAQYAAGTPVIVVYPLATETTEQTTPHALHSYEGTTIVEADTNVDPVALSVEYASSEE